MDETKICPICHEEKDILQFYKTNKRNPRDKTSYCRSCRQYSRYKIPPTIKICLVCGEDLPYYRFDHDAKSTDKLKPVCRTCASTHKVCSRCGRAKLRAEFPLSKTSRNGVRYVDPACYSCVKAETYGVQETERTCLVCGNMKALSEFYGNNPICRVCSSNYKKCSVCGEIKPLISFPIHSSSGMRTNTRAECSDCRNTRSIKIYHADVATSRRRRRELFARRYAANPQTYRTKGVIDGHKRRDKYRPYRNDLSKSDWNFLLDETEHKCPSCGKPFDSTLQGKATADHVYSGANNLIDGLTLRNVQPLCNTCNASKGNRKSVDYRTMELRLKILVHIEKSGKITGQELVETRNLLLHGTFNTELIKPGN